jgi:transposase-like protein
LRIPKLRAGSFFPSLLERRRRVDQALFAVVMEAYLRGVSTRKADDLAKALGADTGISKSEVSRICADLDAEVGSLRDRSLTGQAFPYVSAAGEAARRRRPGEIAEAVSARARTSASASVTRSAGLRTKRFAARAASRF